jgi:hypothetical protein
MGNQKKIVSLQAIMNKTTAFIAIAGLIALASCKEKKPSQEIIITRQEVAKPQAPISMQDYKQTTDVTWMNATYHIEVVRMPSDSLPMVKDEYGQQYVDNSIVLTVTRNDGSVFFKRTFTKASFSSYIDEDYRRTGILEALIFEEVDDNRLEFAVSVAHPQSEDEFIPLEMKLDRDGGLTIKRDNELDTNGDVNNNA